MANRIEVLGDPNNYLDIDIITEYEFMLPSRNVIHNILNRRTPEVTMLPISTREGTLNIVARSYSEAMAVVDLHRTNATFLWTSDDLNVSGEQLYYVLRGAVTAVQDQNVSDVWTVSVEYKAVS
ncbi:hypothetical protein [Marisediminicola sp. LYQ85]|uniref:hypothetical protein n=1 Tax=Marisediminicola sp. LYQ85 TaxID=3391062 RepID=UPI003982E2B5